MPKHRIDYSRRKPTERLPTPNVFSPDDIVRGYQPGVIIDLFKAGKRLIDFIPLARGWPAEQEILLSWESWFRRRGVPFAVCMRKRKEGKERVAHYTLWKEDVAEPRPE